MINGPFCTASIFPLFSTEYSEIILLSVTKLLTFPLHGKSIYTSNPAFESLWKRSEHSFVPALQGWNFKAVL